MTDASLVPGQQHTRGALPFNQVDVFSTDRLYGNPVAVVHDSASLTDHQMAAFARWTNLSETTFLLPPTDPAADYRVRIFTPTEELPFAGHPTLGSAHAWLEAGGSPQNEDSVVQECAAGLVRVRRSEVLAFEAPPLRRHEPADADSIARIAAALRLPPAEIQSAYWVVNGPKWVAALLKDADTVLGVEPDFAAMDGLEIGIVGRYPAGSDCDVEVRGFVGGSQGFEDPVTGSLNAGIAQWLIPGGQLPASYVASQGTVLGCRGRVHVRFDEGRTWVGGATNTVVRGSVELD
ncbi:PhzF family phenazine biosynthesis protein [Gordonia sp. (in: high G+C Gram-positive bacteria)]|uniref:PhzF family phenazine biosynthesis protein n=1 Tax=Gordonia sp. (in: high G+C Gram-positive bacteria) TaxID=84139 RepID=UPI003C710E60